MLLCDTSALGRIEYPGDDQDWGFARYDPATETYPPALLRTGPPMTPSTRPPGGGP
jgi:hypothetical protein